MAQKFELPLATQFGYAVASVFIVLGFALSFIEDKHTALEDRELYDDTPTEEVAPVEADKVVASGHYESEYLYRMRI